MHNMQSDFNPSSIRMIDDLGDILIPLIQHYAAEKIFVLMDSNTHKHCYPKMEHVASNERFTDIVVHAGEKFKTMETVQTIWQQLLEKKATRNALFMSLGGGVITDIGGFAASTYKRGMPFVHLPTTLMAQVDAAIGGKCGVNYSGYKNQVGVIEQPKNVFIYPDFLNTLDKGNLLSGFAEIIKYAFISDKMSLDEVYSINPLSQDVHSLKQLIQKSVEVKSYFVEHDPYEKNIRKALNFGHNFAHAFESVYASKNKGELSHGHAVAAGLICEIYLSHLTCKFPFEMVENLASYILKIYGKLEIQPADFDYVLQALQQDKKNKANELIFTLINNKQEVSINEACEINEIEKAFHFYLER